MYENNMLTYLYGGTFEKYKLFLIRTVYSLYIRLAKIFCIDYYLEPIDKSTILS